MILKKCVFKGGNPQNMRISQLGALGAAIFFAGVILRAYTYRRLGRFFRFDISIQKDHELIKTGPYSYVRHPSYGGLLVSTTGWLIWTFSKGSWVRESGLMNTKFGKPLIAAYIVACILPPSLVTLSRMHKEDDALKEQFGDEWEAWAMDVPYSIIPGLY
ncbi:hypothetical protein CPB83DRAFT_841614 [Crepidotus variabilis]|uniref:Protein-S-isoprenylcysteine O-methyltransferase n=1 Tax=Crepidotus variabilis TaxID=179855 RepID=A0A9P6EUZ9_9AGAR|nr:hypothetical protein CPB83DRAFT_841614 [Crepidotus variabilis]